MCNFRACFRIQRTYRMPKDIHVEPERFAAELISRLETVLREREAQERLEERLKRVRLVSAPPCVCVHAFLVTCCDSFTVIRAAFVLFCTEILAEL